MTFLPKPVQSPRIPIIAGGGWPNRKPFRRAAKFDGVVPISANWPDPFTPEHLKEVLAYIAKYRENMDDFEVMVGADTSGDPEKDVEIVQPFIEAGATWWSETLSGYRGTVEENRERIRKGPPKV